MKLFIFLCLLVGPAQAHELLGRGTSAIWKGHDSNELQTEIYQDAAKILYEQLSVEVVTNVTDETTNYTKHANAMFCIKTVQRSDASEKFACALRMNPTGVVTE
ncbi:MAG: hypothetical protein JNM93_08950 [Bacteriovoracaceae bacterium]|nr:hypothetical protein [Bacteriovoracaceae bacterium]